MTHKVRKTLRKKKCAPPVGIRCHMQRVETCHSIGFALLSVTKRVASNHAICQACHTGIQACHPGQGVETGSPSSTAMEPECDKEKTTN